MPEFEVGQLAQELATNYMAHAAMMTLMRHPATQQVIGIMEAENTGPAIVPIEDVLRNDGSRIVFDLSHALRNLADDAGYRARYSKLWISNALVVLGDALRAQDYFDKDPTLEFVRHLRNGVGHGNRFNLRNGEPLRPAHFTGPAQRLMADGTTSPPGQATTFEITPALSGQVVLFDFIGAGDVIDLFHHVALKLIRIGNGDPPSPLYPQRP